ncbi:Cytochrome P450 [Devosia enhydra]|uniref:Cytochrome P450 n=1 Tax=Devosia enhydra TaxID=665118 RepID=A0A1K2I1W1_9HYPH|nr:cytochrome P450 [Devosia enhydra]SFZ86239.1 Cytochrome P450 [Devosia enhydra]
MITLDFFTGPLASAWRDNPCGVLFELAQRFPGQPVAMQLGDRVTLLLIQDAASARHVLHLNSEAYGKHFGAFLGFFGESRLTADEPDWRRLQKLSQPYITAAPADRIVHSTTRHVGAALDGLLGAPPADAVEVDEALNRAAASVVADVTFGFGPDDLSPSLFADFRNILSYASRIAWNVPGARQPAGFDDALERALDARSRIGAGLDRLVARQGEVGGASVLSDLAAASRRGEADLLGEVSSLLFAGFDTSAAAMGWAMWLLAGAPNLQRKLRDEVRQALDGAPPSARTLALMPQVMAFQDEVLRIFPPIPILGRKALVDDRIGDIPVSPGQIVLVSIVGLHHDPRIFPEPRRVSLTRHSADGPRDRDGQFIPFGLGRRVCGGARIANIELTTAIALMLDRLQIDPPPAGPMLFDYQASLRRKGGHRFSLSPAA